MSDGGRRFGDAGMRRGLRARSGTVAPGNLTAPVIAGTMEIGQSFSITAGTYVGTPPITLTYTLYRDGVPDGTEVNRTEAQAEAYVMTADDIGPDVMWRETATSTFGFTTADSNEINFRPETYGTPAAIYEADAEVAVDGSNRLTGWGDLSSNGNDLSVGAFGLAPLLTTDAGNASVRFASARPDALRRSTGLTGFSGSASWTVYFVGRHVSFDATNGNTIFWVQGSASDRLLLWRLAAGNLWFREGGQDARAANYAFADTAVAHVIRADHVHNSASGRSLTEDGTLKNNNANAATVGAGDYLHVGALDLTPTAIYALDAHVHGLYFFREAQSASQKSTMAAYLDWKWGV